MEQGGWEAGKPEMWQLITLVFRFQVSGFGFRMSGFGCQVSGVSIKNFQITKLMNS